MINPKHFFEETKKLGINFFTGVPDSLLKHLCYFISDNVENENHIISKISNDEDYSSFSGLIYNYVKLNHDNEFKNNTFFLGSEQELKIREEDKKSILKIEAVKRNENIDIDNYEDLELAKKML